MPLVRSPRTALAALVGAAGLVASLAGVTAPTQAAAGTGAGAPVVQLRPAALSRGADVAGVHVQAGKAHDTLVDAARRLAIPGRFSTYLGRSASAYVVKTVTAGELRTVRLRPDGTTRVLHRSQDSDNVVLATGGDILVAADFAGGDTDVSLIDAHSGKRYDHRVFRGDRRVLDATPVRVVLGGFGSATVIWRLDNMRLIRISEHHGYLADLATDRLATMTKDPYYGGCTVVTTISAPRRELWRSCDDQVDSFSPDAALMATADRRTDGLGPTQIALRTSTGRRITSLRTTGWFGPSSWESTTSVLVPTSGRTSAAVVRCTTHAVGDPVTCERASRLEPRQQH